MLLTMLILMPAWNWAGAPLTVDGLGEALARSASESGLAVQRDGDLIQSASSERALCDIYDALLRREGVERGAMNIIEERFSRAVENGEFAFSAVREAALLLKLKRSSKARAWLEKNCGHKEQHIRMASAWALGMGGRPGAEKSSERLKHLLEDRSTAVRVVAAEALWKLTGDAKTIVPVLAAALEEPAQGVILRPTTISEWALDHRHVAVGCLMRVGAKDPRVVQSLMPLLREEDTWLRVLAIRALRDGGEQNREIRRAMEELAKDADPAVRSEAVDALRVLPE